MTIDQEAVALYYKHNINRPRRFVRRRRVRPARRQGDEEIKDHPGGDRPTCWSTSVLNQVALVVGQAFIPPQL
ncbi:MAG: hypothetical protein PHQ40_18985 [Anaerolineaceae bacterium]|nr:hypothetical protein [Anaerolineaceae bacterium]